MNKRNKLKKGIIKVTYFDKKCNCNISTPILKVVDNKKHSICSTCNCVCDYPTILPEFFNEFNGKFDSDGYLKVIEWFNSQSKEEFPKWVSYLNLEHTLTYNEDILSLIVRRWGFSEEMNWKPELELV